ncbi:MAG: peptidoglycan bridge formation glycyltransferase FemA/FemB family protein [Patescibacteria group bacterium]|nr:peptidoglycan bridge formation glycyltransferase FemA/FemB family protein [Patescibacteria group bacterium]
MNIVYYKYSQKNKWDEFVAKNSEDGGLLQSFDCGLFKEIMNKKIWRIGIEDKKGNLLTCCLAVKESGAFRINFIDIYRGPIIKKSKKKSIVQNILIALFSELKRIAAEEKAIAIRTDFGIIKDSANPLLKKYDIKSLGFKRSYRDIQPRSTLFIDLKQQESKILSQMKPKHRYNIRLAEKKGVKIKIVDKKNLESEFNKFWRLLELTSLRDNFAIHKKKYYKEMLKLGITAKSKENFNIKLYIAERDKKIIAAAIVGCFGDTAVYMHGASDNSQRALMAPHLLQWKIIQDVKESRYSFYDLGGIKSESGKSSSQESWSGITRFKIGFAPKNRITEFFGLWEIAVKPIRCNVYKFLRKLSRYLP